VIGRSEECQLALDDPLTSRKHAVLRVGVRGVTVVDLGSRNGVSVNGEKIANERRLKHGDRVTIGGQEMVLSEVTSEEGVVASRTLSQTLGDISIADVQRALAANVSDEPTQSTAIPSGLDQALVREQLGAMSTNPPPKRESQPKIVATFKLLSGMADKALAMGRAEEADRILGPVLHEVLDAQKKKAGDANLADQAIGYAVKLAGLTQRGSWIDYVFEMHTASNRLIAGPVVDDLHGVIRRAKVVNLRIIRDYLAAMKSISASFTPNERFVLQRIEGIEQICALK
jgi:pSer/pThr/pTyr-binding forkhead associated (FHA) protein